MVMILGKKVGMTQVYDDGGKLTPVTVIEAGPCVVMQIKTAEKDGYSALQLGYDDVKNNRRKKPALGHAKKAKTVPKKFVREWRLDGADELERQVGDAVTVDDFAEINCVDVTGTSKGKGFAGVMKRHGFGGFPASHGTERKHRAAGSISSFASDAGHGGNLKKGKRMAGHMGCDKITSKRHNVVSVDKEKNLLVVSGSIPGPAGGYVVVRSSQSR